MELWNSLGCKICRKPLELCESINQTSIKKHARLSPRKLGVNPAKLEGTFRQQLQQGAKAEELDPQPVAAKCGHIYHRGCLKKLTTELNSSCIECLICLKPIVLAQALPIKFYSPDKDAKGNRTLTNKKRSIGRHSIHLRSQELDDKLVELFGTPNLDERYEENVRFEKEAILQRVKDLTNRNSQLLASIEEKAKSHYLHEGEEGKNHAKTITGEKPERHHQDKAESPIPAKILFKPAQVSRQSRSNMYGDSVQTKADHVKVTVSNEKNLCDHLEELLKGFPSNRSPANGANGKETSLRIPSGERATKIQQRIPLASVTRSMQQLFEQEKLKYLQKKSKASDSSSSSSCDSSDENDRHLNEVTDHGDGNCQRNRVQSFPPVIVPSEGLMTHPSRRKVEVGLGDNVDAVVFPDPLSQEEGFSAVKILNLQAEKAKHSPKVLATKHLKFVPTRVSVRGKRSFLKSHPSLHYKVAFPSLANEQKPPQPVRTQDVTRVVLNATKQRRQQWKPHVIEEP
ncbi:unnamed protein product [Allacma fusca]|uniref:RING-type domain-containing protein n=1 Tax=Allacma fusca TaxID=39272 RepID=A0A8J2KLW3_9HEXA|nr:unnamed protein product [Allacma fusca]